MGYRTLLVDFDPQSNLSTCLGVDRPEFTVYGAIMREYDTIVAAVSENLDILPSTLEFAEAEFALITKTRREYFLKKALDQVASKYEVILIDCPPSIGVLTINALVASQSVIVPVESHFLATSGLVKMINFIKYIRKEINEGLDLEGVFLTKHDPRVILNRTAYEQIKGMGVPVYHTFIRRNIALAEAPAHGQDIFTYDPESNGAVDYASLASEILSSKRAGVL